jgi:septal ring factor EnvC (AmiA/AmiB activator)
LKTSLFFSKSGRCNCGKVLREKNKIRPCFTELEAIADRQKQNLAKLKEEEENAKKDSSKISSLISEIDADNKKITEKIQEAKNLAWKMQLDLNEMYRKKK